MDWVSSEQIERQSDCEPQAEVAAAVPQASQEDVVPESPCTHDEHQRATESYEEFVASTKNHRPWQEPDRDIDIILGDCVHCDSTLGWSKRELPKLENEAGADEPNQSPNPRRKTLSRFLIEEAVITHEELVKTQELQGESLSQALVESGVVTAAELEPYLRAYEQAGERSTHLIHEMLCDRPQSQTLETITNQMMRSLTNTAGVRVTAERSHTNVYDTIPCDYTICQSLVGDFEGDVYWNLPSAVMLQIASTTAAKNAECLRDLVEESALAFLQTVNSNACVQLSALGIQVALLKPRIYRHAPSGDGKQSRFDLATRSIGAVFTAMRFSHPGGQQELCFVDATCRF